MWCLFSAKNIVPGNKEDIKRCVPPSPCLTPPSPGFIRSGGAECFLLFLLLQPQEWYPAGWAAPAILPSKWKVTSILVVHLNLHMLFLLNEIPFSSFQLNPVFSPLKLHSTPARWLVIYLPGSSFPWVWLICIPITPTVLLVYVPISSRNLSLLRAHSFLLISKTLCKYLINVW